MCDVSVRRKAQRGHHVENVIRQIVSFIQKAIETLFDAIQFVWLWSFGQIVTILRSDWQSLPVWKIVLLFIGIAGVAYLLYVAAKQMWAALRTLFNALLGVLTALVAVLPYILGSGVIAFAVGYLIKSVNL
jgi:hypothetical protein